MEITGKMGRVVSAYWHQVVQQGLHVPRDRPLDELTAELTTMLGDPDPRIREEVALATLGTWIHEGVYDELLSGLGAGMCTGLMVGLGERETDTVFRRSYSALVLTECIERDSQQRLVSPDEVLSWGDRVSSWLVREQDLRGFIAGHGWAHAVAHGADAIGALARSPRLGANELTVLLDVIADRLLAPTDEFFVAGEPDRLALAVMHVLRRDLLDIKLLQPWVMRLAHAALPGGSYEIHPFRVSGNVQAFLRSLQLQLALAHPRPEIRSDLLLVLVDQLVRTNSPYVGPPPRH